LIRLNPTGDGLTAGSDGQTIPFALLSEEYSTFNIIAYNLTFNNSTNNSWVCLPYGGVAHCRGKITCKNIDNSGSANIGGLAMGACTDCLFEVIIDDVNSGGGGTGYGVFIDGDGDDNTFIGSCKNCDTNLSNGGTNNNVAALNVA